MPAIKEIANYKIVGQLGKGGMGDVYKAIQEPLGRTVALKVMLNQGDNDEESVKRFETEARAISRLNHNNIVSLYEYGEESGLHYFAMQYVDGKDLNEILKKEKKIPIPIVMDFAKQISRGLLYAHNQGIVHRDIKPHNILIDRDGNCLISDFGIAQIFKERRITVTGKAVGTPEYMSPEQAKGGKLDQQTDIYSLGILLYEMVTGEPPFTGQNPVSVAYNQVHSQPLPPSLKCKSIPKRLELVILKALKKDKKERYQNISTMLDDLDTVVYEEESRLFSKRTTSSTPVINDKRITDRRSGDRRNGSRREEKIPLFSFAFIKKTLSDQWLSLILVLVLYIYIFAIK